MTLRLSAALALCGRPPIVLIDDVLSVGDIAFQQKCIDRVHALKDAGCDDDRRVQRRRSWSNSWRRASLRSAAAASSPTLHPRTGA